MANRDWPALLNSMSVDSLRFEKQKRLPELEYLEYRIALMQYQEGRSNDEWEQSFEEVSASKAVGKHFNAGGYETEVDIRAKRAKWEHRITELETELRAIDEALESKLR